jgi:hypothetical protein
MRFSGAIAAAILQFTAVMAAPTDLEARGTSCTLTSFSNLATVKKSCTTTLSYKNTVIHVLKNVLEK